MKQTPGTSKDAADKLGRGIKRKSRKHLQKRPLSPKSPMTDNLSRVGLAPCPDAELRQIEARSTWLTRQAAFEEGIVELKQEIKAIRDSDLLRDTPGGIARCALAARAECRDDGVAHLGRGHGLGTRVAEEIGRA